MGIDIKIALTLTAIWVLPALGYLVAELRSELEKVATVVFSFFSLITVISWIAVFIIFVWGL